MYIYEYIIFMHLRVHVQCTYHKDIAADNANCDYMYMLYQCLLINTATTM